MVSDGDRQADDVAARAAQRDLVRRGYDAISAAYRGDDGQAAASSAEDVSRYAGWAAELAGLLPAGATVADLGCGIGLPATRALTDHRLRVIGVDFSAVQLTRARRLVPAARLVQADMTALHLRPGSMDAVVLAITGAQRWTGTEPYLGADMFWDHADTATYLKWLTAARFIPVWHRYIPEGTSGHSLILARAS